MTAKVLDFTGSNTLELNPKEVVESLGKVDFSRILVIGYDENEELVCHSDTCDIGKMLLLMERAKYFLLHEAEHG